MCVMMNKCEYQKEMSSRLRGQQPHSFV